MIESLLRHQSNAQIWVLCLSDECQSYLEELDHKSIHPCSLSELESSYPELLEAKENRNLSEYYFTLSPFFPDWVLKQEPEIDFITYLDSDLEFYCSPEEILEELKDYSIGIIEHRFHPSYDHSMYAGRFNVGWIFFKNDQEAKKCLSQWKRQCSEWCKDQPEDGKFADQMYLNSWPDDFKNVRIIDHPGANLAPWNLNTHKLTLNQSSLDADGEKIIFYHFHMLRQFNQNHVSTSLGIYKVPKELRKQVVNSLYLPHLKKLGVMESKLRNQGFGFSCFNSHRDYSNAKKLHIRENNEALGFEDGELIPFKTTS